MKDLDSMISDLERQNPRARHCRHYDFESETGSVIDGRPVCRKGCDLTPLGSWCACLPNPAVHCAVREDMTDKDIEERCEAVYTMAERNIAMLHALPNAKPGDCGTIQCPNCKLGSVRWFTELRGGYLTAACSTPKCCWVIE